MRRFLLALPLLVAYAVRGQAAVTVWESDLTLWRHARAEAPALDRPRLNYAKALWIEGYPLSASALYAQDRR